MAQPWPQLCPSPKSERSSRPHRSLRILLYIVETSMVASSSSDLDECTSMSKTDKANCQKLGTAALTCFVARRLLGGAAGGGAGGGGPAAAGARRGGGGAGGR